MSLSDFPNFPSTETFWFCEYGGFHPPVCSEMWDLFCDVFDKNPQLMSDSEYEMVFGESR